MRHALVLLLALTALTACDLPYNPSPIGRGYSSYNEEYKTPPGAKPSSLGYKYSPAVNQQVLDEWRAAVADLLNTLESKKTMKNDVYVVPAPRMNAFFATFDHVLREELTARGYHLARNPSGSESISYDAQSPDGKGLGLLLGDESDAMRRFDGKVEKRKFILSLYYGLSGQPPEARARSMYDVPESGYYLMDQMLRTSAPPQSKELQP